MEPTRAPVSHLLTVKRTYELVSSGGYDYDQWHRKPFTVVVWRGIVVLDGPNDGRNCEAESPTKFFGESQLYNKGLLVPYLDDKPISMPEFDAALARLGLTRDKVAEQINAAGG